MRNEASSCPGIFSRPLRFYYVASSPCSCLDRLSISVPLTLIVSILVSRFRICSSKNKISSKFFNIADYHHLTKSWYHHLAKSHVHTNFMKRFIRVRTSNPFLGIHVVSSCHAPTGFAWTQNMNLFNFLIFHSLTALLKVLRKSSDFVLADFWSEIIVMMKNVWRIRSSFQELIFQINSDSWSGLKTIFLARSRWQTFVKPLILTSLMYLLHVRCMHILRRGLGLWV